jgi:hypothetical protein
LCEPKPVLAGLGLGHKKGKKVIRVLYCRGHVLGVV